MWVHRFLARENGAVSIFEILIRYTKSRTPIQTSVLHLSSNARWLEFVYNATLTNEIHLYNSSRLYHAPPERVTDPELHDVSRSGETPGPRVNTVVHFVGRLSGAKVLDRKVESQWVTTIASGLSIDHCAFLETSHTVRLSRSTLAVM